MTTTAWSTRRRCSATSTRIRLRRSAFPGWVGPEPHGAGLANCGLRRDPLIAERVVAWLQDRYARRRAGDPAALRPFLLVASFVNPHDIVLFPTWALRSPLKPSPLDPPHVPPAPTADEDLRTKPAAQIAFREAYYSGYGPAAAIQQVYDRFGQRYRDLYYRLHAEVDTPDRPGPPRGHRRFARTPCWCAPPTTAICWARTAACTRSGSTSTTRPPGCRSPSPGSAGRPPRPRVVDAPTSHVDLVPTLLGAAGVDVAAVAETLRESFSEVHPLPGRNLMPVVDGAPADDDRAVYLMTRDNMLEGDSGASGLGRRLKQTTNPPAPLRIRIPAHTAANFEGLVVRSRRPALWKLVRSFDDPSTWTEPGVRQLAANGFGGEVYRTSPLDDQWELYDLTSDPIEADNRWNDPGLHDLRNQLRMRLKEERARSVPERNNPWPYASRRSNADREN